MAFLILVGVFLNPPDNMGRKAIIVQVTGAASSQKAKAEGSWLRDGGKLDGVTAEVIEETKMPRKYHTIDTCDNAEVIAHLIKDYGVPREQICWWSRISDRTLRWYLRLGGRPNPVGSPKKIA